MKQFQCTFSNGTTSPQYSEYEVAAQFPLSVRTIRTLGVGETAADCDGDLWVRLPDHVAETASSVVDAERLERIATAVITGLCANSYEGHLKQPLSTAGFADMANIAVEHAKALIAELDAAK